MAISIFLEGGDFAKIESLCAKSPALFKKAANSALRKAGASMRRAISKNIRPATFLKGKEITGAISKLKLQAGEVNVVVSGRQKLARKFRLLPNRITAKKGMVSRNWPAPKVAIGPGIIKTPAYASYSKPFIAKINGLKAMYVREKGTGKIKQPKIVSPQYFAVFESVKEPILATAEQSFCKNLHHEIDYRLELA